MDAERERELRYAVDQGEFALTMRDGRAALRCADEVLFDLDDGTTDLARAALRLRASALEVIGDLDSAILTLTNLTSAPYPDTAWIVDLIALSRCHREAGNLEPAIAVGSTYDPMISDLGLAETTEAIQLAVTVAMAHIFRGELAVARRLCKRAIIRAQEMDSPIAMASAYWNASLVEVETGNPAGALDLARLALCEFERGEDTRNLARLRLAVAELYLHLDPPDTRTALAELDQVERDLAWSTASGVDFAQQYMARFNAHMIDGDYDLAHVLLSKTADLTPDDALVMRGWLQVSRGRLATAEDDLDGARAAYQDAVRILTGAGSDRDAAQAWFELATALSNAGDSEGAREAYRRAAISNGVRTTGSRPRPPSLG